MSVRQLNSDCLTQERHLKCLDLVGVIVFAVFFVLAIRYQIKLLDYLTFGDEAETIVAAKMMASGQRLYSEIFNHHGPLTFISGFFLEKLGAFGVSEHRIPIALLQVLALAAIYFSPLLLNGFLRKIYTMAAAAMMLLFFSELFGSMYIYQVMVGLFLVVILAQYTLPAILTPDRLGGRAIFFGNMLIACLPFFAITYVPVSFLLFISSLRRGALMKSLASFMAGVIGNVLFLICIGSVAGFFAFHLYLNAEILPLYNGGQSGFQLIQNAFNSVTGGFFSFTIFVILLAALAKLAGSESGIPWRSFFVGLGIASLLIRGLGFHGLPYYYSLLAIPLVFFSSRPAVSQQSQVVAIAFILVCSFKLSLLIPLDRQRLESSENPKTTEFSRFVQRLTDERDRIIAYSFNNHEYIAANRLPASGHFFYLPWQEKYNERPKFGVNINACEEISLYRPKIMLIDKWKVWDAFSWESYASCIQALLDKEYVQLSPRYPYYLRSDIFLKVVSGSSEGLVSVSKGLEVGISHLAVVDGQSSYKVIGEDPFIIFKLSTPLRSRDVERLVFEMACNGGSDKNRVPVQVFWRTRNSDFSERDSIFLSVNQGVVSIDLSKFPNWTPPEEVTDFRLDLDSPSGCSLVSIKNLNLAVSQVSHGSR